MSQKLEARIERLRQLRSAGPSEDVVEALRKGLKDRGNLIIAEAAKTLVEAMTDTEDPVRTETIRALAQLGGDDAALLLRLKAQMSDRRPLVIGHAFDALISLEESLGVTFVAKYLDSARDEIHDEAALSLGASRRADAVEILIGGWGRARSPEFSRVLLRAMSSSQHPAAIDFLLDLVRNGNSCNSAAALEALQLIEPSEEIRNRIEAAKGNVGR